MPPRAVYTPLVPHRSTVFFNTVPKLASENASNGNQYTQKLQHRKSTRKMAAAKGRLTAFNSNSRRHRSENIPVATATGSIRTFVSNPLRNSRFIVCQNSWITDTLSSSINSQTTRFNAIRAAPAINTGIQKAETAHCIKLRLVGYGTGTGYTPLVQDTLGLLFAYCSLKSSGITLCKD